MNQQELAALLQEPTLGPYTTEQLEEMVMHRARCVECGRTVQLQAVYDCYVQAIEPECGHSWMMYQFDGQYVLG